MIKILENIIFAVAILATAFCVSIQGQSQGDWPIKNLVLTGHANGSNFNFLTV